MSWPSNPGTADVTQFVYGTNGSSRYMSAKTYADNTSTQYTYTPDGKIATRTWARNNGSVVTTYGYYGEQQGEAKTGELHSISYSDGTPTVMYAYNRHGRESTITQTKADPDGWTHTITYGYNDYQQLSTEAITGNIYGKTITRSFEGSGTGLVPGREAGFSIGEEYAVTYGYDNKGRLDHIAGPGLPEYGVKYSRLANSDLIADVAFKQTENADPLAKIHRSFESNRNFLNYVENTISNGATVVSNYDYANDDIGRRENVVYTGTAFAQNHMFVWGYNTRSELTSADRRLGTDPDNPGNPVTPKSDFDYGYDPIGNRNTYTLDSGQTTYTTNSLNQYTATANPAVSLTYDLDGNLTDDGTLTYEWDGENRLKAVYPTSPDANSEKCVFTYDYMSRRVRKQIYVRNYDNTGWEEEPNNMDYFIYDGWNVIMTLDGVGEKNRVFMWGLDLSGSIHGAGGIGGLLAMTLCSVEVNEGASYWYFYDGNGNVGQVLATIRDENGDITGIQTNLAARYEYDPYGNTIVAAGDWAEYNPIRFSTKWFDDETGLGYWGYRYYNPKLGRWVSRDPIGEKGGMNLYAYVNNEPYYRIDYNGHFIALSCILRVPSSRLSRFSGFRNLQGQF